MKKNRITLLLLIVLLAVPSFYAGPVFAKPPPGADLTAVRYSEEAGFAVLGRYELYLSQDGRSWRPAGLAGRYGRLTTLAQGPGNTMVAAESGKLLRVKGVNRIEAVGPLRDPYGGRVRKIKELAVGPGGTEALASPGLGVLMSGDGGLTWKAVEDPFWSDQEARQVIGVGFAGRAAVVVTREGVYVLQKERFVPSLKGLPETVRPTATAAGSGTVLIALPGEGIYETKNGTSWKKLRGTPHDTIAFLGRAAGGYLAAGPFLPLHLSDEKGGKWESVGRFSPAFVPESSTAAGSGALIVFRGRGLMQLEDNGLSPVEFPYYLASLNATLDLPGRLLAGTQGGVFYTEDGGVSWTDATPRTLGSPVSHFLRLADGRILLASLGSGVFITGDGGVTWENWNQRLGTANVVRSLIEDGGEVLAATEKGLMSRGLGGGDQWKPADRGIPRHTAYKLVRGADQVWCATISGVYRARKGEDFRIVQGMEGLATSLDAREGSVLAVVAGRVLTADAGGKIEEFPRLPDGAVATAAAFDGDVIRAGTNQGVYQLAGDSWEPSAGPKYPVGHLLRDPAGMRVVTSGAGTYRLP
jgi:photosystem II stability/assembly factor-like uncharacterized protein